MQGSECSGPTPLVGRRITFLHPGPPDAPRLQRYVLGRAAGRRIYQDQLAGQVGIVALRRDLAGREAAGETLSFELDHAPGLVGGFQFTLVGLGRPRRPRRRRVVKCLFEEGVLAGMLQAMSGTAFFVEEVGCRGGGAESCLFAARPIATF